MDLFWSMNPPDGDPDQAVNSDPDQATYFPPEGASFTVDLTVAVGDRQLATRSLTRQWLGDGVTVRALRTDTDQVAGVLALPPAGSTPRVAVLAMGGSGAVPAWSRRRRCSPPTAFPRSPSPTSTTPAVPTSCGTSRWSTSRLPRGAWPPSPACGVGAWPPWATRAAPSRRCWSASTSPS